MRLNTAALRYLTAEDWRVLTAFEQGSKNHEVVPTTLAKQIAGLRNASKVLNSIANLAKIGLIARVKNAKYDGYRLTYYGYDYLALKAFSKRKTTYSVGNQIGVGKESDIYVVADEGGTTNVLKVHRLGRISFRTIKNNRDYLKNRKSASWMYMSRLAAMKEYAAMKILHANGFPVPRPIDQTRHCIVMEFIDAYPMRQFTSAADPSGLYATLMSLIVRLASQGLIHGDFNEFNILVYDSGEVKLIDFPQIVSTDHPNAQYYFERDVECIHSFFQKLGFDGEQKPKFADIRRSGDLDVQLEASGFTKKHAKELEDYQEVIKNTEDESTQDGSEIENIDSEEDLESGPDNETSEQEIKVIDQIQ